MAAELKKLEYGTPSAKSIVCLTEALEEAKSGQLLAVAVCWCDRDGRTHTQYANDSTATGRRDLVAAISLLWHRVVKAWDEG